MISREEFENALIDRHTKEIHEKINNGSVTICGLGGLGSNIAISLARAGIGRLHLIDFDIVDITNINRQQYFIRHIGMKKTQALREILMEINPFMEIRTTDIKICEENIGTIFSDEDVICEAFDDPESKALLVNYILEKYSDKFLVAASGMAGYGNSNEIRTRKIGKKFCLCGDEVREGKKGRGLMAPRVMICAGHEGNAILEYLINKK